MKSIIMLFKKAKPAMLLVTALIFLLVVYGPCEQYLTNVYDFSFDIYDLLVMFIPLFLILLAIAFAVLLLAERINSNLISIAEVCLMTAIVAFYVQGTFFSKNLPIIDGHIIDWIDYSYMRCQSILIWLASAFGCFLLFLILKKEKFSSLSTLVGGLWLIFLLLSSVFAGISNDGFLPKDDVVVSSKHINELSDDHNFIIILLDAVDAVAFDEMINDNEEYKSAFNGFTFYKNTVACYQYTAYAMPMILSGEKYLCNENYYHYLKRVYTSSPLFAMLKDSGYSLNMYNPDIPKIYDWISDFNNIEVDNRIADFVYPVNFVKTMFKLSGLKYFPYDLKKKCNVTPTSIMGDSTKKDTKMSWDSQLKPFDDLIQNISFSTEYSKNFSFIYLDGAHSPFETMSDLSFSFTASYNDEVKASALVVKDYLEKLKSCNAYDNTIVVVLADHGFAWRDGVGRQNPFLMVKGINDSSPFSTSDVPVSHENLLLGFEKLLNGGSANEAFSFVSANKERPYYESDGATGVHYFTEYMQYGYADDLSTLQPTGTIYTFQ